jgi:hypothetical protein
MSTATVMQPSPLPKLNRGIQRSLSIDPNSSDSFVCFPSVQHTIEGARNVKSNEEIEQLLRDYPAALELYRTGKYKVKVKCEVDVERVILVEKRIAKAKTEHSPTSEMQHSNQLVPDTTTKDDDVMIKHEITRSSRSRTQSRDRQAPTTNSENIVQTASSSIRVASNTQPKVDHYPNSSKESAISITPPAKYYPHRLDPSVDPQYIGSQVQHQGRVKGPDYPPRLPSVATMSANIWQQQQQQRAAHPYFSHPLLNNGQGQPVYMPAPQQQQQHPHYQQGYFVPPRPAIPSISKAP